MRYEILNISGEVENTIMASLEFVEATFPGRYREVPDATAPEPAPQTQITILAFLSRFTDKEAINLDLASNGATVEAATLRRYQSKVNAASFIDLSREDTRANVLALEPMGILAEGRALEILDAPIQDHEVYR